MSKFYIFIKAFDYINLLFIIIEIINMNTIQYLIKLLNIKLIRKLYMNKLTIINDKFIN